MAKQEIIGPGYLGRSSNVNASRCVNLYPELNPQDSKSVGSLVGTPGTLLYVDTLLPNLRGMHYFNNLIYFVAGDKLYSVNSAGFVMQIIDSGTGIQVTLATATGPVSMADNGMYSVGGAVANQLVLVDGINTHCVNVSTLATVSFPYPANTVCFIGGYFVIDIAGAQWRVSDLYDGTTWPGLYISTADASPDNLMTVVNNHNELWLIGEYTTEIWYQSGTGNPPFARQGGGVIDYGTNAPYSVAKGSNTLFWLVNQRNGEAGEFIGVGMISGYGIEIISPQAINDQISRYAVTSDAFAYCYADRGHEFYVLTFPTANATWVYDATTRLWHERSLYTTGPYVIGRHIGNCHASAWGSHFIGDFSSGKIYKMSENYYTDNGLQISSIRTGSPIDDKSSNYNFYVNRFQLDIEPGVGDGSLPNPTAIPLPDVAIGSVGFGKVYFDGNYILAVNYNSTSGVFLKINRQTNTIVSSTIVGKNPYGVAQTPGYYWVTNRGENPGTISQIDSSTNLVVSTLTIGSSLYDIVYAFGFLWVAEFTSRCVFYIDPATSAILVIGPYASGVTSIDSGAGSLWITLTAGQVKRINPTTHAVIATIVVGASPQKVLFAAGFVWVANSGAGTVSKIDPATNTVGATITVGTNPTDLAYDSKYILVTNFGDGTISRINITTNAIIMTITSGVVFGIVYDYIERIAWSFATNKLVKYLIWQDSGGANPQALLSWSVDGGHTWSNDHPASIGKQGEYIARAQWWRLGKSRNRIFRIAISDPVKKVLMASYIDVEGGAA